MADQNFMHDPNRMPELSDEELQDMLDTLGEKDITVEQLRAKLQEIEANGGDVDEEAGGAGEDMPDATDMSDEELQELLDQLGETQITVEQLRAAMQDEEPEPGTAAMETQYDEMPTGEKGTAASASPVDDVDTSNVTQDEVAAEQARLDSQPGPSEESTGDDETADVTPEEAAAEQERLDSKEASDGSDTGAGSEPSGERPYDTESQDAEPDGADSGGDGRDGAEDADQDRGDGGEPARAIAEGEVPDDTEQGAQPNDTEPGEASSADASATEDDSAEATGDAAEDQAPEETDPNGQMTQEIMEFFGQHDEPTDEDIKALASHYDITPSEMQEMIYAVLAKLVAEGEDVPQQDKVIPTDAAIQGQAAEDQANQVTPDAQGTVVAQPDGAPVNPQQNPNMGATPQPGLPPASVPPQGDQTGQGSPGDKSQVSTQMPTKTPQALSDYYDPMIAKPGFTGSGYVDPNRQGPSDTGQGSQEDTGEGRERVPTTNDSRGLDQDKATIPEPTSKLGAKSGDVEQLAGAKTPKAQVLEQALKEAGYTQPIRIMFSKAADNILQAAGLQLKEVTMTMPSGQQVRSHRWMKAEDARGRAPRSIGQPSDPKIAFAVQRDLRASLSEHGHNPLMLMSVRDTDEDHIKHVFLSKIHEGSSEKPRIVVKLRINLKAGATTLTKEQSDEVMAKLEEAESYLSPPRSKTTDQIPGGHLQVSKHAWQRASERTGFEKVASELQHLEGRRMPQADWYHPIEHDGIIAGQDSVVKTVLSRNMQPKGIKIP